MPKKKISICVPCYNEEKNIESMYEAIKAQMETIPEYDYEILFADNASEDSSEAILRSLATRDKEHVRVILNNRNFGPTRSGINCLNRTSGDAVITIPCDFQEPPEMIPTFIHEWAKGSVVVWGQKTSSDERSTMWAIRSLFYWLRRKLTPIAYDHVTGFGIIDHKVIESFQPFEDIFRGVQAFVLEFGYPVKLIPYKQNARKEGKSSYTIASYFDLALREVLSFSNRTIRTILVCGILCVLLTLLVAIVQIGMSMAGGAGLSFETAALLLIMLICSGTLVGVGLVGEVTNQILQRVTSVPIVVEKEVINFSDGDLRND